MRIDTFFFMLLELNPWFLQQLDRILRVHVHSETIDEEKDQSEFPRSEQTRDWSWNWIGTSKRPADFCLRYPWTLNPIEWSSRNRRSTSDTGTDIPQWFWIRPAVERRSREIRCPETNEMSIEFRWIFTHHRHIGIFDDEFSNGSKFFFDIMRPNIFDRVHRNRFFRHNSLGYFAWVSFDENENERMISTDDDDHRRSSFAGDE